MDECFELASRSAERWDDGWHRIELISPIMTGRHWGEIEPLLDRATERSWRYPNAQALYSEIVSGIKQCWLIYAPVEVMPTQEAAVAVVVTSLHDMPEMRVCRIVTCSGSNVRAWADMGLDEIESWARASGAARMVPLGRPGWGAVFKRRGYQMTHVQWERDL